MGPRLEDTDLRGWFTGLVKYAIYYRQHDFYHSKTVLLFSVRCCYSHKPASACQVSNSTINYWIFSCVILLFEFLWIIETFMIKLTLKEKTQSIDFWMSNLGKNDNLRNTIFGKDQYHVFCIHISFVVLVKWNLFSSVWCLIWFSPLSQIVLQPSSCLCVSTQHKNAKILLLPWIMAQNFNLDFLEAQHCTQQHTPSQLRSGELCCL